MASESDMSDFQFGHVNRMGPCCGKPAGCTIDSAGCLYKRLKSREDPTVRCQATSYPDTAKGLPVNLCETWQCRLPQNPRHVAHDPEPIGVGAAPILALGGTTDGK